jgi:hypothetical protein
VPAVRRDCGGVRILDFQVGDRVVARDPTKARGEVIAVTKYEGNEHDKIRVRFEDGEEWDQCGFWYRKL